MEDDVTTAENGGDDTLHSILQSAYEEAGKEMPTDDKPVEAVEDASKQEQPSGERARDEKGRFVAKDESKDGEGAGQVPEKPATGAEPGQAATTLDQKATGEKPLDPPLSWNAQDREHWSKLPPEIQAIVARRENERDAATNKILGEYKPLTETLARWKPYFDRVGATPVQAFDYLIGAEYQLRTGTPAQKLEMLRKIASDYQIPWQQPGEQQESPFAGDPLYEQVVAPLNQKIASLEAQIQSRAKHESLAVANRVLNELRSFADAKSESGQPLHPYFDDVVGDMTALAAADRAAGREPNVKDLYERAVWSNPAVRQKLIDSEREAASKAAAEKLAAEQRAKEEAKRKAGLSVNGSPGPGPSATEGSLRDQLTAALQEAGGRI